MKSYYKFSLFLCMLLFSNLICAQENFYLHGKITDETGDPIAGVAVLIKGSSSGAITDAEGQFQLGVLTNREYTILTSHISYGSAELTAKPGDNLTIVLHEKYNEIMDVGVFGYRVKNGYWVDSASLGTLGKISWQDNPFSIYTVTEERIRNLQASNLTDVLKAQPVVQSQTGGSRVTDYFTSRGFSSSVWTNNTSVEGLISHNPVEPVEDKARVEVMNGPNSLLYGITSPGGMVNSHLKRPTSELFMRFIAGNYGGKQGYVHADVGGPVGKYTGYRINLVYVNSGETNVENQTHERYLASIAVDQKITSDIKVSVDASYFNRNAEHTQSIYMIGTATKVPSAPDASKNHGSGQGFANDFYWRAGAGLNWKISKNLQFNANFRAGEFSREYVLLRRAISRDTAFTVRVDYQGKNYNVSRQGSALLNYTLKTGNIAQDITVGYISDYLKILTPDSKATRTYTVGNVYYGWEAGYPQVPLFDTIVNSGSPYRKTTETGSGAIVFTDKITLNGKVDVLLGLNYSNINDKNWNAGTGDKLVPYKKGKFTPGFALMYRPSDNISSYISYIQALQKGTIVGTDANCLNSGQILNPYVSSQTESGVKASVGRAHLHLAGFIIQQANLFNDSIGGGSNEYRVTMDGRAEHKGIEFTVQGIILNNLSISSGITILSPKIIKTSTASLKDKEPQGVAKTIGKLFVEYAVPFVPRLLINGTLNYTGKEWVDVQNTMAVPSVFTGDLGARYKIPVASHFMGVRLILTNITDVHYWTTRSSILYLGDPRTFAFSLEFLW